MQGQMVEYLKSNKFNQLHAITSVGTSNAACSSSRVLGVN